MDVEGGSELATEIYVVVHSTLKEDGLEVGSCKIAVVRAAETDPVMQRLLEAIHGGSWEPERGREKRKMVNSVH